MGWCQYPNDDRPLPGHGPGTRAPPTRHVVYSGDPPSAQCVGGVGASTCASVQDTPHLYLVLGWRAPAQPPSPDLGPVTDTELEQVASSSQIAAECKLKVNISQPVT